MSEEKSKPILTPPSGITDKEQLDAAQERWEKCPLDDCKRKADLLYEDFYLRDIRTNRLMCSACAVRAEMGYMAREVIRASDDRFFTGNQSHNLIVLGVMAGAGLIAGLLSFIVGRFGFFGIYFAFIIGGAIGGAGAALARRLTSRKVTRQMHYFGGAGIILGAFLAILAYSLFTGIPFEFIFGASFLTVGAAAAGMFGAAWGVLMRRI